MADPDLLRTVFAVGGVIAILFLVGLYLVFRPAPKPKLTQPIRFPSPPINPLGALIRNIVLFLICITVLIWLGFNYFGRPTITYIAGGNVQWAIVSYRDPDDVFQTGKANLPFESSFTAPLNKIMQISVKNQFIEGIVSCEILVNGVSKVKKTDAESVACMVQVGQ